MVAAQAVIFLEHVHFHLHASHSSGCLCAAAACHRLGRCPLDGADLMIDYVDYIT